jgi:hypothetical protein
MEPYLYPDEQPIFLDFIKSIPANGKIVEWGSGGSTVKILDTITDSQSVISIEHDKEWYDKIFNELTLKNKSNWTLLHRTESGLYQHNVGTPDDENPVGYDEYIFPDDSILDGNFFFIDGVARSSIALMLLARAKNRDAVVLIHDANHRGVFYSWAARLFPKTEMLGTSLLRLYLS